MTFKSYEEMTADQQAAWKLGAVSRDPEIRKLRDALERIMDTPHYENPGSVCPPCMAEVGLRRDLDASALKDGRLGCNPELSQAIAEEARRG